MTGQIENNRDYVKFKNKIKLKKKKKKITERKKKKKKLASLHFPKLLP